MKQIEAHEFPLHEIFRSTYDFQIPNYQRPYAWEPEQAGQLLSDLVDFLDEKGEEPYFLGSIVLIKQAGAPEAEVIDGQQRLTTLTILLAVLRDLSQNPQLRQELDAKVAEPGELMLGRKPKPRLTLRSRDADFFSRYVQTLGSIPDLLQLTPNTLKTDAQRSILANAKALHAALADWTEERLLSLVQLLAQRTFLVVVSTPDLTSAHRIFSVMNARGLDLSPADVFKSYIIGDLSDDEHAADKCASMWEDAEESLGRQAFADLFLHLRMLYAKERSKRELLKEFPKQVLVHYLPGQGKAFVTDVLVPYADAYETLRSQNYTSTYGAEKINAWLRRLSELDNQDWQPPALWALRNHSGDPAWLEEFFRALERLAANLFIRRVYTTPRVNRYAELLRQLDTESLGLAAPAFELTDSEREAAHAIIGGPIYESTKIRRYVLLRLNEMLAPDAGITFDFPLITVEHVLPQNPRSDSQWLKDFTAEDRAHWTHRLANLVLLNRAKNAEAQNLDFAKKKAKYFTGKHGVAPFPVTIQVMEESDWTTDLLEVRQDRLTELLTTGWRI